MARCKAARQTAVYEETPVKTLFVTTATLLMLSAAPALAMSCCGGGKGKGAMMCAKSGGMAMNHTKTGKKGGCCCEGMGGSMSRRG